MIFSSSNHLDSFNFLGNIRHSYFYACRKGPRSCDCYKLINAKWDFQFFTRFVNLWIFYLILSFFFSKKGGPWISTIVYAIIKASVSEYDQKYVMFSCLYECFVCLFVCVMILWSEIEDFLTSLARKTGNKRTITELLFSIIYLPYNLISIKQGEKYSWIICWTKLLTQRTTSLVHVIAISWTFGILFIYLMNIFFHKMLGQ